MPVTSPAAARAPRWMKLLLAVSLGLNLAVAGMVVGRIAGGPKAGAAMIGAAQERGDSDSGPRRGPGGGLRGIGPLGRALAHEDRRAIGQALRAERGSLGTTRQQMRARMVEMGTVLRATPFVRADMEALLQAQRETGAALAATGEALLLDRLESMSDAERAAFADRLAGQGARR